MTPRTALWLAIGAIVTLGTIGAVLVGVPGWGVASTLVVGGVLGTRAYRRVRHRRLRTMPLTEPERPSPSGVDSTTAPAAAGVPTAADASPEVGGNPSR